MTIISPGPDTEKSMVALLHKGDQAAFCKIYDEYAPPLLAIIRHIAGDDTLADEILRNAFVRIWAERPAYNPAVERLFNWMLRLARTVAQTMTAQAAAGKGAERHTPLQEPITDEENQMLLYLVFFRGYNIERVATELNTTPELAKIKVINAMKQLKGKWVA